MAVYKDAEEIINNIELYPWEDSADYEQALECVAEAREIDVQEVKWVPVKERLPKEKNEKYWVCTDTGYQCECRWTNANRFWSQLETDWHWNIVDIPQYSEVVAWMPLPKPYEEVK